MNKQNFIIISFFALTTFISCTKTVIDETGSTDPIDRIIKYNPDVESILLDHCSACHAGSTPIGGFTLSTYDDARFSTENGTLLERINNGSDPMPPTGLISAELRQIIAKWAEDGYLEN